MENNENQQDSTRNKERKRGQKRHRETGTNNHRKNSKRKRGRDRIREIKISRNRETHKETRNSL